MNELEARQARFNAESRGQWDHFAGHRERVLALLGAGAGASRLCVLGAGNANDLDLPALLRSHREVHLVDLDAEALERGAARQGVAARPTLYRHGGLDLTGMLGAIARWSPTAPIPDADLEALVAWPGHRVGLALPGPFEVVASTCLLSQLVGHASHAVGDRHPRFAEAVRAVRLGHLRLLAALTAPRGRAVLITDVVSSENLPEVGTVPEADLAGLLARLAGRRGLIHGVRPADLLAVLRDDPITSSGFPSVHLIPPWRWQLHERSYLVWAVVGTARRPD